MFGKPVEVGLKTSNFPNEPSTISKEIISAIRDETDTRMQQQQSSNVEYIPQVNTPDDADDEAVSNYKIQRETDEIQMQMHVASKDHRAESDGIDFDAPDHKVEQPPSPSMVSQRQFNIISKRKIVKYNLEAQAFRMTRQAQEKFPPAEQGDTVKVLIPDVDLGRCDSQNVLCVVVEVDSSKSLCKTGATLGKLNSWYA